ncbi:MAG: LOG family protein, partial [Chloroflexi bacterium]|nr:LOG family protein [Chloroflexota bacterium]
MPDMKLDTPEDILREVREIVEADSGDLATFLYQQLIINSLKCKRDELGLLDLKVINRAVAEFRYAARVFKPYKNIRKVSIFGSARTPPEDPYYRLAVKFSRMLVEQGFMVITGAGNGIMKAGNEGAGKDKSFGINILLPFEQAPNEFIVDDPKLITFRFFFTRKIFFLMEAHAVALFPGGFGTHDEVFETLTLLQTGKNPPMPLVLMELPGEDYWESWDYFVREQMLGRGLISEEDLS